MGLRTVNWCETSLDVDFGAQVQTGLKCVKGAGFDQTWQCGKVALKYK